uniref:tRNA-binding domain-containing protein n=1 Tax=Pseudo-nitzschia australis TaxID=44445 RepID=A0A7S4AT77_9STRA|mmetsp:Transcript_18673/g.39256  ORF Transcript_18673/g.39256 Transcript_18673/m.39256 type:complete len:188 (-) Transcript_18673:133-696(-)
MSVSDWISSYKVGKVESLEETGGKGTKALKICKVDVGVTGDDDGDDIIQVVTSAPNVRLGTRLAVAPIGSFMLDDSGGDEPILVKKTTVGGHLSQGIFCDSRMLGWEGGSVGITAQMDESLALGSPPPGTKPRPKGMNKNTTADELAESSNVEGLFKKKLTKEEKKKLAEERKKARKAKKASKEDDG